MTEENLLIGKTVYPDKMLKYNQWCKKFRVSTAYTGEEQVMASEMNKQYDFNKMKEISNTNAYEDWKFGKILRALKNGMRTAWN